MSTGDELRKEMARQRYEAAAHAMQSGVAFGKNSAWVNDPAGHACNPKHLRVGINTALCDHAALVRLLIALGLFTEAEYVEALADEMEREAKRYEQALSKEYGGNIKLH